MNKRKNMRITLPAALVDDFHEAKAKAERDTAMTLSDTQFATRLISQAVKRDK